jgi:hypothetical protein
VSCAFFVRRFTRYKITMLKWFADRLLPDAEDRYRLK